MSDISVTAEEIRYHLTRIAAPEDGPMRPSRATGLGFSPEAVLRILRETPDGVGLEVLFRRLSQVRPNVEDEDNES
jgi:hypothetical protein